MAEIRNSIDAPGFVAINVFALEGGVRYTVEAEGAATGAGTLRDPVANVRFHDELHGLDDDGGVGRNARIIFTAPASGDYFVSVAGAGTGTGSFRLRVWEDDFRNSVEGVGDAGRVRAGRGAETGRIDYAGDVDVIRTTLVAGLSYRIALADDPDADDPLGAAPVLRVRNAAGDPIAFDADGSLRLGADHTGAHFLEASADPGATGAYRVSVGVGRAGGGDDRIRGSARADAVDGGRGEDHVSGGGGHDSLSGGRGADLLRGQAGNDTLQGGRGADVLRGGPGDDLLQGGPDADVLVGGRGDDVFRYLAVGDSSPEAMDVLRGGDGAPAFQRPGGPRGSGDLIDLSDIDANVNRPGDQAFDFGERGIGGLRLSSSGEATLVRGNVDGDPAFEFALLIRDGAEVEPGDYRASDFIL